MPLKNKSTIASGMLAPSGLAPTFIDPAVQSTARPPGVLLQPSPGYDSVREGKNRFQGKGPTGGFRHLEFAEDVGGTGAALSVIPGQTTAIEASEWLPESPDQLPEGSVIIADRELQPGTAVSLHQGMRSIPDMGDRTPDRPLSKAWFHNLNPASALRSEYAKSPVIATLMAAGFIGVVTLIAGEAERAYKRQRGQGIGSAVTSPASGATRGTGEVTSDAIDKIGKAGDDAVKAIEGAADKAVTSIENAAKSAT